MQAASGGIVVEEDAEFLGDISGVVSNIYTWFTVLFDAEMMLISEPHENDYFSHLRGKDMFDSAQKLQFNLLQQLDH